MLDAARHWLREKAEKELVEARYDLCAASERLQATLDCPGIQLHDWHTIHHSDLRHDARSKVRFLLSVVIELGGKP